MNSLDQALALKKMIDLGISLSSQKDIHHLLEDILIAAKELCHADAATIYSINDRQELVFETIINDTLNLFKSRTAEKQLNFNNIPLFIDNEKNTSALVTRAVHKQVASHIADVYKSDDGALTAALAMDKKTGYHTQSVLTLPMLNHHDDVIGVIQLINAKDEGIIVPFEDAQIELVKSMGALAAIAITNNQLLDEMEGLFHSLAKMIAKAIDEKSPYTGGHCRRVPRLTMLLAEATSDYQTGALKDFNLTEEARNALDVAGWLHDCGKIATPEYIMDKSTKLETLFDRIHLVEARFNIIAKELEIAVLKGEINNETYQNKVQQIKQDLAFLKRVNIGGEFLQNEDVQRVQNIANSYQYSTFDKTEPILSEQEVSNLQIQRGTLTNDERKVINRHIDITIMMLESLPFPKHLKDVPEYAGGHHEKMDGTGYPKGLTKEQMSVPARIMAIADIFEALTAADRPYKPAKSLSESLGIMKKMAQNQHIDSELFRVFIEKEVYLDYANEFLKHSQIDTINHKEILAQL